MLLSSDVLPPSPSPRQEALPTTLPPCTFDTPPLIVLPGDDLTRFILSNPRPGSEINGTPSSGKNIDLSPKLGNGLAAIPSESSPDSIRIISTLAGRLIHRPSTRTWFVASNPRRYHPSNSPSETTYLLASTGAPIKKNHSWGVGDRVIGMIEDFKASSEYYRVNIFGSHSALLHILNFEGATKRNRPTLEPGCLIYCRIVRSFCGGRMDPEVSCKVGGAGGGVSSYNDGEDDGGAARKDWLTNEGTYGPLHGGTSFRVSIGLARELLQPKNVVLSSMDQSGIPFEVAIGVNGMVWVNSPEAEYTIVVLNAIQNSEVMSAEQVRGMVKTMVKNVKKKLEDSS